MDTDTSVSQEKTYPSNTNIGKKTYTVADIANILQLSKAKAYQLCNGESFTIIRLGRSIRIPVSVFDAWLESFNN